MRAITATLIFFCLSQVGIAQNILSAHISYEIAANNNLLISYHVLASEGDTNLNAGQLSASISCMANGKSVDINNLQLASKQVQKIFCDGQRNPWAYTFTKTIDLKDTAYASIVFCCNYRLDLKICCRDSAITGNHNGGSKDIYVFNEFNYCGSLANRQSVQITGSDLIAACQNQPYHYNLGAADKVELDSVSYAIVAPMTSASDTVQFSSGLYPDLPVNSYFPGTLKYPYSNPSVNPPIGFYIDAHTGDFIFTPTKKDEYSGMAIQIKEWRKNTSGKMEVIGLTHKELGITVNTCPGNNPPIINGPFAHQICAGEQICFDITTDDKLKVPPPPAPAPQPDSVTIKWNRGIPGGHFTILNPKALHQTARFCWTPENTEVNALPYTFTATARDNFCPMNAQTVRAFSVKVHAKPEGRRTITRQAGDQYRITFTDTSKVISSTAKVTFQLRDYYGALLVDSTIGSFHSSGNYMSTTNGDIMTLNTLGVYIIQTTVSAYPGGCSTDYFDTIVHFAASSITVQSRKVKVYPNPANDIIRFPNSMDWINIYASDGKLIHRALSVEILDVSSFLEGIYTVHYSLKNVYFVDRIIIIH